MKWEATGSVSLRQLTSGNFAMYPVGGVGSPFWVGPASGIAEAYATRPKVRQAVHVPRAPKSVAGLDLSKLDFNI